MRRAILVGLAGGFAEVVVSIAHVVARVGTGGAGRQVRILDLGQQVIGEHAASSASDAIHILRGLARRAAGHDRRHGQYMAVTGQRPMPGRQAPTHQRIEGTLDPTDSTAEGTEVHRRR